MEFRRLRISGFKSFADPIEIEIGEGVTGIVGPNGCGKSNLTDALRWVMAEASFKNMRGGEMEDVIFSGTSLRPGREMAEVSLLLDNRDGGAPAPYSGESEIEISRRIEREAGSVYRINGRETRARDVSLFFADISAGAHSTTLVGQGRMDEIITARPADRRRLLEEAAGITGLHARRHEAELRLKAAQGNLERLEEVSRQTEARLRHLKRQARAARRYRKLSEEIERLESLGLYVRWREAGSALEGERRGFEKAESGIEALERRQARLGAAESQAELALPGLRESAAAKAAACERLVRERGFLEKEAADALARLKGLERSLEEAGQDIRQAEALARDAQEARRRLGEEQRGLGESGEDLKKEEAAARQRSEEAERLLGLMERGGERSGEAALPEEAKALLSRAAQGKAEAAAARGRVEEANRKAGRLKAELDALRGLLAGAEARPAHAIIDLVEIGEGFEAAFAAALGDDVTAAARGSAVASWESLPPLASPPELPPGAEPLARHVRGPEALARRLSQTGLVSAREGDELQSRLAPGQRLVSREGHLWRWDGYRALPAAAAAAQRRLEQWRRLAGLDKAWEAARSEVEAARAAQAAAEEAHGAAAAGVRARIDEAREAAVEVRGTLTGLRRTREQEERRVRAVEEELARWDKREKEGRARISVLEARAQAAKREREALARKPEELAAQSEQLSGQIGQSERAKAEAESALGEAEARRRKAAGAARAGGDELGKAREAGARARALVEAAERRLAEAAAELRRKCAAAPEEVPERIGLEGDAPLPESGGIAGQIEKLTRERQSLGAPNLQADEEAESIMAEHGVMLQERGDLEAAVEKLRQGIRALNREGRTRLLSAFEAVNGHFQILFKRLFGGGEAHLDLIEAEDPLEAGVEIMARPPGKRLQRLTLLSGGEKALTALALLFAAFMTRPAPVCVLDEADAPLDDLNVGRFCDLVEQMARESRARFLIVTHNPITLSRMDRLYGVTMAEEGVSRLVSVELAEAEALREPRLSAVG